MAKWKLNVEGAEYVVDAADDANEQDLAEIASQISAQSQPQGTEAPQEQPSASGGGVLPTVARAAGGVGAGLMAASGVGIPAAAGVAVGSDALAQWLENREGTREGYNPIRGAVEAGMAFLPFDEVKRGADLVKLAIRGGMYGAGGIAAQDLAEGRLPDPENTVLGGLVGAATGGLVGGVQYRAHARRVIEELDSKVLDASTRMHFDYGKASAFDPEWRVPAHGREDLSEVDAFIANASKEPAKIQSFKSPAEQMPDDLPVKTKLNRVEDPHSVRGSWRLAPMTEVMSDLQKATGISTYDDLIHLKDLDHQASKLKHRFIVDRTDAMGHKRWGIESIFKGTSKGKRAAYNEWLEAPDKEAVEQAGKFTPHDRAAVRHLRAWYDDLFEPFGIKASEYLENYAPHLRKVDDHEYLAFMDDANVPESVKFFADMTRTGALSDYETDSLTSAMAYLQRGTFKNVFGPTWKDLAGKYNALAESGNGAEVAAAKEFKALMSYFEHPNSNSSILTGLQKFIDKLGGRKYGITANNIIGGVGDWQTLSLLGGSPNAVGQNLITPALLGIPRLNPKWFWRGVKAAATKEGRQRAEDAGASLGSVKELFELSELPKGRIGRALRKTARVSMKPFAAVEGRSAIYNGQYLKTIAAAKKAGGNVEKFISLADADRMVEGAEAQVRAAYSQGNIEEAARLAGNAMVAEVNYNYGSLDRPAITRGPGAKLGAGYGVWPMNYTAYALRMVRRGPAWKRARDLTYMLGTAAAVDQVREAVGRVAPGDAGPERDWSEYMADVGKSTVAPLFYTGGPIVSLGMDVASAGRSLGQNPEANRRLERTLYRFIPGARAAREASEWLGFRKSSTPGIRPVREVKPYDR